MPALDPLPNAATHRKACWVDVTDPQEQAYAEKRQRARLERLNKLTPINATSSS
jgi:hypothetical protein